MLLNILIVFLAFLGVASAGPINTNLTTSVGFPMNLTERVTHGKDAPRGKYAFYVTIETTFKLRYMYCSGILLNMNTVLTAGHCARGGFKAKEMIVRIGSLHHKIGGVIVGVEWFKAHRLYKKKKLHHDIAIMKLTRTIFETSEIKYAKLPEPGSYPKPGEMVTVVGLGKDMDHKSMPESVQEATMPVMDRHECARLWRNHRGLRITEDQICAGGNGLKMGSCYGDSGGPLVDSNGVLVGVTSWAEKKCKKGDWPDVYVSVSAYLGFIHDGMARTVTDEWGRHDGERNP